MFLAPLTAHDSELKHHSGFVYIHREHQSEMFSLGTWIHIMTQPPHTLTCSHSHTHTLKNICRLSINSTCTRQSDIRRILYFFTNCNKEQREWFRVRLRDPTHELILTPVSVFYDGSSLLKRTTNSTPPDYSLWLNKVRL